MQIIFIIESGKGYIKYYNKWYIYQETRIL